MSTVSSVPKQKIFVMPGLVPGIHDFLAEPKTWMAGRRPGKQYQTLNLAHICQWRY
jgi:hypothetical protein